MEDEDVEDKMMADIARMEGYQVFEFPETPDTYADDIWEQDEYEDKYWSYAPDFKAMELEDAESESDKELTLDSEKGDGGGEEKHRFYQFSSDRTDDIIVPGSVCHSIYTAEIGGLPRKSIIDSGATTLYIGRKLVKVLGLKTCKVHARRVKVADKDNYVIDEIVSVDVKVGNLLVEKLTAYICPLKDIDFVFGLSCLEHHNPHVDFRTKSYESSPNGRKYILSHLGP